MGGGGREEKRKIDSLTTKLLELDAQNVFISCSRLTPAVAKCTCHSQVPNKRGALRNRGFGKNPLFNKRGSQNKWGVRI